MLLDELRVDERQKNYTFFETEIFEAILIKCHLN